ncbi:unnamed protein product [Echinostoma caproni]|uniref:LEM domain-containing protein n=1 Tax=Echinostoma caproni TaxID=27848 RepID=A0A183ADX1_9TREM|nr:unnamed protein product [Echinostoma caproni]
MQELYKAGIKDTRLKAPTVKRWNDVSERRRRLIEQACTTGNRQSVAEHLTKSSVSRTRRNTHGRRGTVLSVLHVAQGIDALSYQSSEGGGHSMASSLISGKSSRPRSMVFESMRSSNEVEIGQEVGVESALPVPDTDPVFPSPKGLTQDVTPIASGKYNNHSPAESGSRYSASYHHVRSKSKTTVPSQSPIRFGIQQMPDSGEKYVLITDRFSPTTLSNACSLNELSTGSASRVTRALSNDLRHPKSKAPEDHRGFSLAPPLSTPALSTKEHSPGPTSLPPRSHTASPRVSVAPQRPEQSPVVHHLQNALLENQALIDSLTSDDRMDVSSDFGSHDLVHSNKDFYQLTSQSEEDFVSDSDPAETDPGACPSTARADSTTRKSVTGVSATKSKHTVSIQPISSAPSHRTPSSTVTAIMPGDVTTSGDL